MANYDVFNGDADGICALHQLRLSEPLDSTLVTGVKRDIALLERVPARAGDRVTVLDVSLDKNRGALDQVLSSGATVHYVDHHFGGDVLPTHPNLNVTIDTASNVCTGLLVNRQLGNRWLPWAVTAAFGDNLFDAAVASAKSLSLSESELKDLENLGTLLNYNGYGSTPEDLHFRPEDLYRAVSPHQSPFDFIREAPAFGTLQQGYQDDIARAGKLQPEYADSRTALFILPDESFSRRISGVYSNQLARDNPDRAHALLSTLQDGAFLVSVRAPLNNREGADELCRQFETGGGRKAAAGINHLPADDLDRFVDTFRAQFGG